MRKWNRTVEVLAPAGSFEIMKAVIHAGADAVYLGGDHFGARAYAGNFDKEELLEAIEYAHLYNRKIYLTVNTLLKERELESRLVEYLTPFYKAGLDAVIVQDMGVFRMVHAHFPDMAIHASTQMAITGKNAAKILQDMGTDRVVTARELNLRELQEIHKNCNVEIESFVHGALCYCYSGQCLLSSMNGGRSGNRGRCAQPCRMEYDVLDAHHNKINGPKEGFVLSPKDMCALDILPQVIEAGVYSLKIEGRMKNVTYAAGVTALYRKYVDMYFAKGKKGYHVTEQDRLDLMDLYNRGAFTSGYYNSKKGAKMMSVTRPNHMGTQALRVCANRSGKVTFEALEQIHPQDVFEVDKDNSFSSGQTYRVGERFVVNLPKKYRLTEGMILNRTRNGRIVREVEEKYVKNICKQQVDVACFLHTAEPMQLILTETERGISVHVEGDVVLEAQKQPITKEKVEMQIRKTGDTPFVINNVTTEISENAFVPIGQLNELRRSAFVQLHKKIIAEYQRNITELNSEKLEINEVQIKEQTSTRALQEYGHSVMIKSFKQLASFTEEMPDWIYIEDVLYEQDSNRVQEAIEAFHTMGCRIACVLPYVTTGKHEEQLQHLIYQAAGNTSTEKNVDAFLVRNLEQIGVLKTVCSTEEKITKNVITDASLYVWNKQSIIQLQEFINNQGLNLIRVTLPYEQTAQEMCQIDRESCGVDVELVVYTRIPVMVSEQCVKRTLGRCDHANGSVILLDQKKQQYMVQSRCSFCYSVMYHAKPLYLLDLREEIAQVAPQYLRMDFVEDADTYMSLIHDIHIGNDAQRGHFVLGVE